MFDAEFIRDTQVERQLHDYRFFSYNSNEALFLTTEEKDILTRLMANIRAELSMHGKEVQSDNIVKDYILLILDYCNRFYTRQFKEQSNSSDANILAKFQQVLNDYYNDGKQERHGIPSVRYCASELCLSAGYFGDLLRNSIGETPKDYIRGFVIMRSKNLLLAGHSISQVAYEMGFDYPNHFTRLFKSITGMTPSQFLESQKKASQ